MLEKPVPFRNQNKVKIGDNYSALLCRWNFFFVLILQLLLLGENSHDICAPQGNVFWTIFALEVITGVFRVQNCVPRGDRQRFSIALIVQRPGTNCYHLLQHPSITETFSVKALLQHNIIFMGNRTMQTIIPAKCAIFLTNNVNKFHAVEKARSCCTQTSRTV